MSLAFVLVFLATIAFGAAFQLMQLDLLRLYWNDVRRHGDGPPVPPLPAVLPTVTIQLPMYNESAVAERILEAVTRILYPRDRLQVQVLDDSTDHCTRILEQKLAKLRETHPDLVIDYRHRTDRTGFKAGNLNSGMPEARGELIAMFDADFVPRPDFLLRMIPHFADPTVCTVQSRWGHLNADDSLATRAQEMFLDAHHTVEQRGRSSGRLFLIFNGSAGIWRANVLRELGGWCTETTTEDLIMSCAAQLRGYRIQFVEDCMTPGELPNSIIGVRLQMFRWFKGGAQGSMRFLGPVLRQKTSLHRRLHAAMLLLAPFTVFSSLLNLLLCGALPLMLHFSPETRQLMPLTWIGAAWFPLMLLVNGTARIRLDDGPLVKRLLAVPHRALTLLAMTAGLSCQCSVAVWEALLGGQNQWVVTPKGFSTGGAPRRTRARIRFPWYFWLDAVVLTYLVASMAVAITFSAYPLVAILSLWIAGYVWFFGGALVEAYWPASSSRGTGNVASPSEAASSLGASPSSLAPLAAHRSPARIHAD